jgi:choline dehydrogenase
MTAMMWVRGFAADYDEWAEHAGDEWGRLPGSSNTSRGSKSSRTPAKPTRVPTVRCSSRGSVVRADRPCPGLKLCSSPATTSNDRICLSRRVSARQWSISVGVHDGAADAYLRPVLRRKNLKLITEATATRVVFDGRRAVGVKFDKDGGREVIRARREVVLSAGIVNSPQLLMLSGIGHREHLQQHGIDVVHHSPQVGENLLDHLVAALGFDVEGDTLFAAKKPLELVNYLIRRSGMLNPRPRARRTGSCAAARN